MTEGTYQTLGRTPDQTSDSRNNPSAAPTGRKPRTAVNGPSSHFDLIAGHAVKALIRDRGEPVTAAEHIALMRDATMLAQMTWKAVRDRG